MNKNKLKELVNVLNELSDDVKDWGVDMGSVDKPLCGTPGCHAGLISIVAKDLPELQDIYNDCRVHNKSYEYDAWADTLADFLGFNDMHDLNDWADSYPKIWGNEHGVAMFDLAKAFTDDESKQLTHRDIINHWKQVLVNLEA